MSTNLSTLALVGYGYWGSKIAPLLSQYSPQVFVIDPSAKKVPQHYHKKEIDVCLTDPRVTCFFVATPENTHFDLAHKLIQNKKHVFIEKPLTLKKSEAEALCLLAAQKKSVLFCDYIFLFDPYVEKIKKLIGQRLIGKLLSIESHRHSVGFHKSQIQVSDDLLIHDMYLGEFFFHSEISAVEKDSCYEQKQQIVEGKYTIRFNSNKKLNSWCSWVKKTPKREMIFKGESGDLIWSKSPDGKNTLQIIQGNTSSVIDVLPSSALEKSIAYFLEQAAQETEAQTSERYASYIRHVAMLESLREENPLI